MPSAIDVTKPVYGNPTTQSVRDNFDAAYNEITDLQVKTAQAPFLPLAGGQMDGMISLRTDAINPLELVTKRYVDNLAFGPSGGIAEAPNDGMFYARGQVAGGMAWARNPLFQGIHIGSDAANDRFNFSSDGTYNYIKFNTATNDFLRFNRTTLNFEMVANNIVVQSWSATATAITNLLANNQATISGTTPTLNLVSSVVADEYIFFKTNALKRWAIGADAAQTGFGIYNYDASGNIIGKAFSISKDAPVNTGMVIDAHGNVGMGGVIPPIDEQIAGPLDGFLHVNSINTISYWTNAYQTTPGNYKLIKNGFGFLYQAMAGGSANFWAWMVGVDASGIAVSGNAGSPIISLASRMNLSVDGQLELHTNNSSTSLTLYNTDHARIFYNGGASGRWSAGALASGEFWINNEGAGGGTYSLSIYADGSMYSSGNITAQLDLQCSRHVIVNGQGITYSAYNYQGTDYFAAGMDHNQWSYNHYMNGAWEGYLIRSFNNGGYSGFHRMMIDGASGLVGAWVNVSDFLYWAYTWSDRKLKSNIKRAENKAVDTINKLNIISCDTQVPLSKETTKETILHWDYALIADEVESIIPGAYIKAPTNDDPKYPITNSYDSVRELPLICLLLKANQELSQRITALEELVT